MFFSKRISIPLIFDIQAMRTVLTDQKFTSENDYTHNY